MISTVQIMFILMLITGILIVALIKNSKVRKILFAIGAVFFVYALIITALYNYIYYFNYEKFYNEFEKKKMHNMENFMISPDTVVTSGAEFKYFHYEVWGGRHRRIGVSFKLNSNDYEAWRNKQTIHIDDFLLKDGEGIINLNNEAFNRYCREWVERLAADSLENNDYYFLEFVHDDSLVYGIILNDKTKEIVQFYFAG